MKTAVEWLIGQIKGYESDCEIFQIAKEMEQQQMATFGKAVADKWGVMPVPMSNIKEMLDETKLIEPKKGTDLDLEIFAFLSWLDFNRDVETVDGLLRKDGYDWYNSQWKSWLHNSDAGKRALNYSGTVSWWGGNPGMNDDVKTTDKKISDLPLTKSMAGEIKMPVSKSMIEINIPGDVFGGKGSCIVDTKSMGETTIEFPKAHVPEQYNPNIAQLDTIDFKFYQEANCVDGGEGEHLTVEAKSSLGIDGDGGAFYVLRTEQWAISEIDDLIVMLKRVEAALNATKPTSIHVK